MSGQQHPGSGTENLITSIVSGSLAGSFLQAGRDTWNVTVTNKRTGQVRHSAYRAASADDAETYAFNDMQVHDPDGWYEVYATLEHGVRKLWRVVPADFPNEMETLGLRLPRLIGWIAAVDADEAMCKAAVAYGQGREFYAERL